jgi:hypothetical protein
MERLEIGPLEVPVEASDLAQVGCGEVTVVLARTRAG